MQEKMTGQEIEENTLINRWVNEYMKEKEKREQLEKDYKLLNEKCDSLQWYYDKLNKALNEIIEVIKKMNGEPIITIPDFSKEENYKLIMKQCNEGYVEILNIINKAKGEGK